jgi:hypothetical protein
MTAALQDTRTNLEPPPPDGHGDLPQPVRLRRHGEPPLRFLGWMLQAQAGVPSIVVPPACLWHEAALYQTVEGRFVVEIVAWSKDPAGQPRRVRCHALAFESLGDALAAIECHDPKADICASVWSAALAEPASGCHGPSPSRYGRILAMFSGNVEARFRALVGALLYQLALASARALAPRANPPHPGPAQLSQR